MLVELKPNLLLRKALAIGADSAIRVNTPATDGYQVAKELAKVVEDGGYDLVIAGRESIDYNGGMVPGMLAQLLEANFVNNCISLEVEGENAKAIREIDGGKETLYCFPSIGYWWSKRSC